MQYFLLLGFILLCPSMGIAKVDSKKSLEIDRQKNITLGDSTSFTVSIPERLNQTVLGCEVTNPKLEKWVFKDQLVYDENNQMVPGYSQKGALNSSSRACGIRIDTVKEEDLGSWTFTLKRSSSRSTSLQGVVNLQKPEDLVYRLPDTVTPTHYDLSLVALWDPDWSIEGQLRLQANIRSHYEDTLLLHIDNLEIHEDSVKLRDTDSGERVQVIGFRYDYERQFFGVVFPPGQSNLTLSLNYTGQINTIKERGFFRDYYLDENNNKVPIAVTHFEPVRARKAFPCMDEPSLKATFTVNIGHLSTLTAISNMPSRDTRNEVAGHPGYVWTQFEPSVLMPTYLVAFAVSDYKSKMAQANSSSALHRAWARPDAVESGYVDYTANLQSELISAFEDYFAVNYSLPKLDQICVPNFGAMENWGMITYSSELIILKPELSNAKAWHTAVTVQTHEGAHQWFGNLVTMHWWTDLWLNEGFATYVSRLGTDLVAPFMDSMNSFVFGPLRYALSHDSQPDSHNMTHKVVNPGTGDFFDTIAYSKAASVIRMTVSFLTEPTWKKAMRRYLQNHAFSNARPEDLFREWEIAGKEDGTFDRDLNMTEVMKSWTTQNNYPLVTVQRDYKSGTARLTQTRFFIGNETEGENDHVYKWWIPITYSTVNHETANFNDTHNHGNWFSPDQDEYVVTTGGQDSAVIFNIQYTGYYRVNYDQENWHRIAKELRNNHKNIHHLNRGQVLYDSYILNKEDLLPGEDIFTELLEYLEEEADYVPLGFAKHIYDEERCINENSTVCDILFRVFKARYDEIGLEDHPEFAFTQNQTQTNVVDVMCKAKEPSCVADALKQYELWISSPDPDNLEKNPVNRQAREAVYCTAIRHGNSSDAPFLFLSERKKRSRDPIEKNNLLEALGCTANAKQLAAFLDEEAANAEYFLTWVLMQNLIQNQAFLEAIENLLATYESQDKTMPKSLLRGLVWTLEDGSSEKEVSALKALKEHVGNDQKQVKVITGAIKAVEKRLSKKD